LGLTCDHTVAAARGETPTKTCGALTCVPWVRPFSAGQPRVDGDGGHHEVDDPPRCDKRSGHPGGGGGGWGGGGGGGGGGLTRINTRQLHRVTTSTDLAVAPSASRIDCLRDFAERMKRWSGSPAAVADDPRFGRGGPRLTRRRDRSALQLLAGCAWSRADLVGIFAAGRQQPFFPKAPPPAPHTSRKKHKRQRGKIKIGGGPTLLTQRTCSSSSRLRGCNDKRGTKTLLRLDQTFAAR
jgi:hypothetical protein